MSKKILITGSCGSIGSNFIRKVYFDKLPFQLTGIDNLSSEHSKNNIFINNNYRFHIGDVLDSKFLHNVFDLEKPDIIIHLIQMKDSLDEIKGLNNVIQASKNYGVKKIVYISTDKLYHNNETKETDVCQADDIFSLAKITCENLLQINSIPYVVLRPSNVFGVRYSEDNKIVNDIWKLLSENKLITSSHQIHDWIWVEDLISAIIHVLNQDVVDCVLNVASSVELSEIQLSKLIAANLQIQNNNYSLVELPSKKVFNPIDCSAIRATGWTPSSKDFKKVLDGVCRWYLNNKWFR